MSITAELRKWWENGSTLSWWTLNELITLVDRIDAEHDKAMSKAGQLLADAEKDRDYNYANWQECKQKVLQANITIDELNAEIEHLKDELAHCIELPKDADGETIHVSDEVYDCNESSSEKYSVAVMELSKWGWSLIDSYGERNEPGQCFHYHAPTVEDVLREFAQEMNENMGMYTGEAIDADEWRQVDSKTIAEYAAKLRLREDA